MNKLAILEMFPFYLDSTQSVRTIIAQTADYSVLPERAFFYRDGDMCGQVALVGRGSIRVFKSSETGREVTLYHVQDGEPCLVNMLCVILGKAATATAQTEIDTEVVTFPGAVLRQWVGTSEPLRNFIFETMAARVVDVMMRVEEVTFHRMDSRLATLLLQRFAQHSVITATQEDLAAELGTVREVVGRLLQEFMRRGAIRAARGRVELRDEAILRQLI